MDDHPHNDLPAPLNPALPGPAPVSKVPRSLYEKELRALRQSETYAPEIHNGLTNPYTGRKILNKATYDEYTRERAYHTACEKYMESQFQNAVKDLTIRQQHEIAELASQQSKQVEDRARQLTKQAEENAAALVAEAEGRARNQASSYSKLLDKAQHALHVQTSITRWLIAACVALLLFSLTTRFFTMPNQADAAYNSGYDNGYDIGYDAGNDVGWDNGYDYGYKSGHTIGYDEGKSDASSSSTKSNAYKSSADQSDIVYVSKSGGKIHTRSDCSGMRYYFEMTYAEAIAVGYDHCSKCF